MSFRVLRTFSRVFCLTLFALALFVNTPVVRAANGITDEDIRTLNKQAAREETPKNSEPAMDGWRLFFQAMGSLVLVLGLIGAIAFVLKRYAKSAQVTSSRSDAIRIVGTKMLGGRRCLMLVRVRGQTLLLGVTPQSINCLTEIHEIEGEWVQPSSVEAAAVPGAFERQLGKFVNETIASEKPVSR